MVSHGDIKANMDVYGKCGAIVATVDHVEGGTLTVKLARDLETGVHHWIPLDWVARVNKKGLQLNVPAEEVRLTWQVSPPHS